MAKSKKITAAGRRALPRSSFALPGRDPDVKGAKGQYPIDKPSRARAALTEASQHATPAQQATIKKNVAKKYPGMKVAGVKTSKKK